MDITPVLKENKKKLQYLKPLDKELAYLGYVLLVNGAELQKENLSRREYHGRRKTRMT